ncbi:MAG: hypothetical protein JNL66_19695 [Alphaproteobacteria bacterium]|nr:hypothetical protein [Alphaproteobacteria bacterium]
MTEEEHTLRGRHARSERAAGSTEIVVFLRRRPAGSAVDTVDVARGERLLRLLRDLARRGRPTDSSG